MPENAVFIGIFGPLAEKEGFEPSRQLSHPTPLAGEFRWGKKARNCRVFGGAELENVISM